MADSGPPAADPWWWRLWLSAWFKVLLFGSALWIVIAFITALTRNPILVPTVILLGSFVAPVAVVTYALERLDDGNLSAQVIFGAFLAGGTVGLTLAGLIETYWLPAAGGMWLAVGIIEELIKAALVIAVGAKVASRAGRDGMVLGAIVGAGFAAFESAGYAFATLLDNSDERQILDMMSTEMTRAVYSPFAHITWTALVGGALFATAVNGRFRVSRPVVLTLVGVILLHGAWDAANGAAIMLTRGIVEGEWSLTWPALQQWIGVPTDRMLIVWNLIYDAFLVAISLVGLNWVIRKWRRYGPAVPVPVPRSGP
jgi:protease PrsW